MFHQKIKEFVQKYDMFKPGAGVLVGLSGGADSVALLEVLCKLREEMSLQLVAVHVHHGIRENAEHDAVFCKMLCKQKGVDYICERIDVPALAKESGMSIEEAARQARYAIFERYLKEKGLDVIAVAHHKNDQAETMLFQLFRGSGLKGLSGIPFKRDAVVRPLMAVSREEIEIFLEEEGLLYVLDATNESDAYSRNKIRHHILPQAEELCAGAVENMNRAALLLRETQSYMAEQSVAFLEAYAQCEREHISLSVTELGKCHIALQKSIIMEAIYQLINSRKDITEKHIESILSLLEKDGEKTISLPQGYIVKKQYDKLIFGKEVSKMENGFDEEETFLVVSGKKLFLPNGQWVEAAIIEGNNLENIPKSNCTKWFDYDKIIHTLVVRTRQVGDYLTIDEKESEKTLQDYFINEKVPKSERDDLWLLADGNHIVWVLGKRISTHYKVTEHTKKILQISIGDSKDERTN